MTVSTYAPLLSHLLFPDAIADQVALNDDEEEDWDYDMSTEQAVSEYMESEDVDNPGADGEPGVE